MDAADGTGEPDNASIIFDSYFKIDCTSENQNKYSHTMDTSGNLYSRNLSAYQIPALSIMEEISGAIYTGIGSFEGAQNLLHKRERITAGRFSEKIETRHDKREKLC